MISSFRFHNSYFPLVPLATPFWSGATYRALRRCLLTGRIVDGPDLEVLRAALRTRLRVRDVVLCGSGSLALELVLRSSGVRSGDEVILPSFCCSAVVPPILACGATPVLVDVGDELNVTAETVDAALTRKTVAVIVPHLFGNPADIAAIFSLAQARGIAVIDDAAQALGANIDDQYLGSFGAAGVVSFGAGKICSGIGGGALIARACDASEYHTENLSAPAKSAPLLRCASTLVWERWRRWTLAGELLLRRKPNPYEPPARYRSERMANIQAAAAATLLRSLEENLAARRARVCAYKELLGDSGNLKLIPHRPGSACLTQIVRLEASRSVMMPRRI